MTLSRVALLSLEPWNEVWRRNQHLAAQLVRQELVRSIVFVNPPSRTSRPSTQPEPGITVVQPVQRLPNRLGGLREVGSRARRGPVADVDLLWINDPVLGAACLRSGQPAVYDVTDDWREAPAPRRIVRRIVRAETRLAGRATHVVCSEVLRERWQQRYGVASSVIHNAVDVDSWKSAGGRQLSGDRPHLGYVGTLHQERLDIGLLEQLSARPGARTIHLVGPNALDGASRERVAACKNVRVHPPVPSGEVPSWMLAFDVLICPHKVNDFTLSLDAIKAYEYLAAGKPVVATPSSGFQHLHGTPGVSVVPVGDFADVALAPPTQADRSARRQVPTWDMRAREMADVFRRALSDS